MIASSVTNLEPAGRVSRNRLARLRYLLLVPAILFTGAVPCRLAAGLRETVTRRLAASEFNFGESASNTPGIPLAWVGAYAYGESSLAVAGSSVIFCDQALNQGLLAPVWIGRKDLLFIGEFASRQSVSFQAPLSQTREITTFMPLTGWLRQCSPRSLALAFVAPNFVAAKSLAGYELDETTVYTGLIGLTRVSRHLTWFYGAAAALTRDEDVFYPYVGLQWKPRSDLEISLVAPWPSISWAPTTRFTLRFGASPAGAVLATAHDGQRLRVGYDSWNLLLTANWQLGRSVWLAAGGGWSGLGSFTIADGEGDLRARLNRGPVGTVQLSYRPAGSLRERSAR